jgi:hypothetical protein
MALSNNKVDSAKPTNIRLPDWQDHARSASVKPFLLSRFGVGASLILDSLLSGKFANFADFFAIHNPQLSQAATPAPVRAPRSELRIPRSWGATAGTVVGTLTGGTPAPLRIPHSAFEWLSR